MTNSGQTITLPACANGAKVVYIATSGSTAVVFDAAGTDHIFDLGIQASMTVWNSTNAGADYSNYASYGFVCVNPGSAGIWYFLANVF